LGEHAYFFEHGDFGTEPEIHVPLLFVAPGLVPAGIRPSATVRSLDVAPTVLDLLGLRTELQFRGVSLLPLLRGSGAGEDRTCFGEVDEKFHEENTRREVDGMAGKWRWMRHGRYKLFYIPHASGPPERRLYDLATDPGETRDLSREYPAMVGWLARDLDGWVTEGRVADSGGGSERETYERLRSLGYIN